MKLKVIDVNLSTGGSAIAIINENDAKKLGIHASDRILIRRLRTGKAAIAVADISSEHIHLGEIGLFEEPLKLLGVEKGVHVDVMPCERPRSIQYISAKLEGKELSKNQIYEIVTDIVENHLSEVEMTYFVAACYSNRLSIKETVYLTNAIVDTGTRININKKVILDKHCVGGVPNNRTTLIVVPILAAMGYTMPKTSSRSITSPAGTADTMEVIAPVSLSLEKIKEVLAKANACMVWGGGNMNLAAADDKLIRIRHPMSIDPEGMLLASIMAKKKAVGATHCLIDIPYGYMAKFPTKQAASSLAAKFVKLGRMLGMKVKVVMTDGSQPIGNGIGPALEAYDVVNVLKGEGPNDLREKSIFLASEMLGMVGEKNARQKVLEVLDSGKAYAKFRKIAVAQGGRKHIKLPKARYFFDVLSEKQGTVKQINNKVIARIASLAGAPEDKAAGIYLRVHCGGKVRKESVLFTIHSQSKLKLDTARQIASEFGPITIK
ncbi:MAG: thymidine phosphorylase family protein [Nanoarchaeota archaeon]|nr:thymidine phosphorylase family protein [Nanoarchaeota archaeon]